MARKSALRKLVRKPDALHAELMAQPSQPSQRSKLRRSARFRSSDLAASDGEVDYRVGWGTGVAPQRGALSKKRRSSDLAASDGEVDYCVGGGTGVAPQGGALSKKRLVIMPHTEIDDDGGILCNECRTPSGHPDMSGMPESEAPSDYLTPVEQTAFREEVNGMEADELNDYLTPEEQAAFRDECSLMEGFQERWLTMKKSEMDAEPAFLEFRERVKETNRDIRRSMRGTDWEDYIDLSSSDYPEDSEEEESSAEDDPVPAQTHKIATIELPKFEKLNYDATSCVTVNSDSEKPARSTIEKEVEPESEPDSPHLIELPMKKMNWRKLIEVKFQSLNHRGRVPGAGVVDAAWICETPCSTQWDLESSDTGYCREPVAM